MELRKLTALCAAVLLGAGCAGCSSDKGQGSAMGSVIIEEIPTDAEIPETTEIQAESFPDIPVTYPQIEYTEAGDVYEAENAASFGGLSIASEGGNFSGDGYVTGFGSDGSRYLSFSAEAPSTQHYDLSFIISSASAVDCSVRLNGRTIYTFTTPDDGEFHRITLYGVFLVCGVSDIELIPEGDLCVDYLKVENNTSLSEISYDAQGGLSNVNAAQAATELMDFLAENYGKYVITGQYVSDSTGAELDAIYKATGKYPVIRFAVLDNAGKSYDGNFKDLDACSDWYHSGGIVGLMWQWRAPSGEPSVYAAETGFSLGKAVTDIDLSMLSQEDIRGLYGEGRITEECYGLMLDLDNMAGQLTTLKNRGVPVLWRPLHEASGGWYWWGASGSEAYRWLWKLMYTRYTEYFGLDNLIWLWNGQSDTFTVDSSMYDIASYDLYLDPEKEFGSRYEQFAAAQKYIGTDKLIAISECSSVPDIDAVFRDNAVWSFFGVWYGDHIVGADGDISEEYTSREELIRAYNSSGALTLDEYMTLRSGGSVSPAIEPVPEPETEAETVQEEAPAESGTEEGYDE
ncbi:MAG: glycoside hydrolase [Ruminococcus sp.]|nr:glycoside hydrolase [Ruminococcus sp.]